MRVWYLGVFLLFFFLGCAPHQTSVCLGNACSDIPPEQEPNNETTQPDTDRPIVFDSGYRTQATVSSIEQKLVEIRVEYQSSDPVVIHVGEYSVQAPQGEGSITAPIRYNDLCILDQDIRIRITTLDGEEVYRELHQTTARVRRPGDWRWWGADIEPGIPIIDCRTSTDWITSYGESDVLIVWEAEEAPISWVDVGWDRDGGTWTMSEDRIVATHLHGSTFTVRPQKPLMVAIVTWEQGPT